MTTLKTINNRVRRAVAKKLQARQDREHITPHIYLAESVEGFKVKIGMTCDLPKRLRQVETASGIKLGTAYAWKTRRAPEIEKRVLGALAEYRQEGEWLEGPGVFEMATDIIEGILTRKPKTGS